MGENDDYEYPGIVQKEANIDKNRRGMRQVRVLFRSDGRKRCARTHGNANRVNVGTQSTLRYAPWGCATFGSHGCEA